jgi:chitin-binding protein
MNSIRSWVRAMLLLAAASASAPAAFGHGLIQDPPSRNWFCGQVTKPDQVANGTAQYPVCGTAFAANPNGGYSFMSVLTHARGRAVVTPLPANVCGFNSETFGNSVTPWDTPMNWPTTPLRPGPNKFTWNISWGPHFDDTEEFRYWITKPGFVFSPNKALAWSDFEDAPFCTLKYDDKNPTANPNVVPIKATTQFNTYCNVPQRTGRHVIYGEWGRNQFTLERFHGCVDAVFDTGGGGGGGTAPSAVITLQPDVAEFVGTGNLVLNGSNSTGSSLTYQWSVTPASSASHRLEDADKVSARLVLTQPAANQTLQLGLTVRNAAGQTNTASRTVTHKPSIASQWTDLGALTPTARMLKAGDTVAVRTVLTNGQDVFTPSPALTLTAATAGAAAWPLALAQAVNAASANVRVGVLGADGVTVTPAADATSNRMYARNGANINSGFLIVTEGGSAGPAIVASYAVNNEWASGYCATITVKNNGSTPATWSATMPVVGKVNSAWNVTWTQTGSTMSFSGPSWAATLQPGASFSNAGFCAAK